MKIKEANGTRNGRFSRRFSKRYDILISIISTMTLFNRLAVLLCSTGLIWGQTPAAVTEPKNDRYVIQSGDELEIRFFYNSELNERAFVRPDGRLSLPLIGEMEVKGFTVEALTENLKKRYQGELRQPEVLVQVRGFANRRVYVGGEVQRPGMVYLPNDRTLLEVLVESGGLKESAKRSKAVVIRKGTDGKPMQMLISLNNVKDAPPEAAAFFVQPLDVVYVTESGISKANRVVDQYIRRMAPILMTGGFTYLFGNSVPVK